MYSRMWLCIVAVHRMAIVWRSRLHGLWPLCHIIEQYDTRPFSDADLYSADLLSEGRRGVWHVRHDPLRLRPQTPGGGGGSGIGMRVPCPRVNPGDILSTTTTMLPKSWHLDELFPCFPTSKIAKTTHRPCTLSSPCTAFIGCLYTHTHVWPSTLVNNTMCYS